MNLNNSRSLGSLTEADLDAAQCCGACDQGRRPCQMPAECCTEVGTEYDSPASFVDLIWIGAGVLLGLAVFAALCGYIAARIN